MTEKIEYRGIFDISQILSAIKQVRDSVSKGGNIELLGNLDKEIKKIEELGATLKAQAEKGFSSPKELKTFENNVNKLETNIIKIGNSLDNINADNFKRQIKEAEQEVDKLKKEAIDLAKQFSNTFKVDTSSIKGSQAAALKKEIIEAVKEGKSLEEIQKRVKEVYQEQLDIQKQKRQELEKEKQNATNNLNNQLSSVSKVGFRTNNFKDITTGENINLQQLDQIKEAFVKIVSSTTNAKKATKDFTQFLTEHNITATNTATIENKIAEGIRRFQENVTPVQNVLKNLDKELVNNQKQTEKNIQDMDSFNDSLNRNSEEIKKNEQAHKNIKQAEERTSNQTKELETIYRNNNNAIEGMKGQTQGYLQTLRKTIQDTQQAANNQQKFNNTLNQLKSRIAYIFSLGNAYYQLRNIIRKTFSDVQSLDKAFASIAMVTDKTVAGLWDTYSQYTDIANRLGQSTESAIKASALFYQQGLDTNEALKLTEDTMKLATLAGADFETATQQMTAALRGFHLEMDQGAHVTDVYSELAANAAADVNGIAYAMSKTASIASSAGMSFESTAAFLTNMIETTQEAPENIGTAMKTIIARFTELKENVAGTDQSEFDDLEFNKVDKALKSVGISIKDANGQFRNLDEVFLELSSKWKSLDRNTQRYIATIAAGSRQQSRFIAMMEDYDRTMELVSVAQDSAGRSEQQFAKYQDTVEYKVNQLKNSWEQFRTSLIDSDVFKRVIEWLTKVVDKMNEIGPTKILGIGAALATTLKLLQTSGVLAGQGAFSNLITATQKSIPGLQASLGKIFTSTGASGIIAKGVFEYSGGKLNQEELTDEEQKVLSEKIKANTQAQYAQIGQAAGVAFVTALTSSITTAIASNNPFDVIKITLQNTMISAAAVIIPQFLAGVATVGLAAAAATAGISLAIAGIAAVLGIVIGLTIQEIKNIKTTEEAWQDNANAIKENAKQAREYANETKKTAEDSEKTAKHTKELKDRYDELSRKVVKTEEEQQEYNTLVNEIKSSFPEIVSYYNEITGELRIQEGLWDSIIKQQERQAEIDRKVANAANMSAVSLNTKANEKDIISQVSSNTGLQASLVEDLIKNYSEEGKPIGENLPTNYIPNFDDTDLRQLAEILEIPYNDGQQIWENSLEIQNRTYEALLDTNSNLSKILSDAADQISANIENGYKQTGQIIAQEYATSRGEELTAGENALWSAMGAIQAKNTQEIDYGKFEVQKGEKGSYLTEYANIFGIPKFFGLGWQGKNINSLTNQLGGGRFGVSDNSFSSLSKLRERRNNEITGELADQLIAAGLGEDGKLIVDDIIKTWEGIYGNEADLEWEKLAGTAAGQTRILEILVGYKQQTDLMEKTKTALSNLGKTQYEELTNLLGQLSDGATQAEIDAINNFIDSLGLNEEVVKEIKNQITGEYSKQVIDLQGEVRDILGKVDEDWSTNTLEQIAKVFNKAEEKLEDEDLAGQFIRSLVDSAEAAGLDETMTTAALQAFDWENIDLTNLDTMREQFISIMQTAMGDSFDQDTVDQLWSNFFNSAEKYNAIDLTIKSSGALENIENSIETTISGYYEAFNNVSSYISEQVENGFIDPLSKGKITEQIDKLELNASDYFSINSDGDIQFLYDKLYEDTQGLISGKDELIAKAKQEYEAGIEQLIQERNTYQTIIDQADGMGDVTKRTYDAAAAARVFRAELNGTEYDANNIQNMFNTMANKINESPEYKEKIQKRIDEYNQMITEAQEKLADDNFWKSQFANIDAYERSMQRSRDEAIKKGTKTVEDSSKKIADAAKKVEEAQKKVIEAQEKLNETLYGTDNKKNKLDTMYNYNNMLEEIQHQIDKTKDKIDNLTIDDMQGSLEDYRNLLEQESSVYQAERKVYEQSIANYQKQLDTGIASKIQELNKKYDSNISTDISQYYYQNPLTGMLAVDFDKLNASKLPDDIRDMIENVIDEINKGNKKVREIDEAMEKRREELKDFEKKIVDGYVKVEDEVIKVLKDKYQEEIDANKEKNEAMADADSEYLDALQDAIDRQRKLRDQQNKWEDLAKKESQAALLARDTSGVNRLELNKLNEEIKDDRQSLLDDTVDDILDNLKQMYDLQKEQREREIELQEQSLDEQAIIREATQIISSWTSPDDVTAWMIANNKEVAEMSDAKLEQQIRDWEDYYDSIELYHNYNGSQMAEALNGNNELINQTLLTTSEAEINEAERLVNESADKVDKAITTAKDSLEDAIKSLNDAIESQNQLLKTAIESIDRTGQTDEDDQSDTTTGETNSSQSTKTRSSAYWNTLLNYTRNAGGSDQEIINRAKKEGFYYDEQRKKFYETKQTVLNGSGGLVNYIAQQKDKINNNQRKNVIKNDLNNSVIDTVASIRLANEKDVKSFLSVVDYSIPSSQKRYSFVLHPDAARLLNWNESRSVSTDSFQVVKFLKDKGYISGQIIDNEIGKTIAYAKGGLVNYTGPAWVDGSPAKPEAFLSAKDTERIGNAAQLLSSIPLLNSNLASTGFSQIVGDTNVEVNINIESISSEVDMDNAIERMKQEIVDAARPQGSSVILRR